jgi:succinate-semialdehyde dehydrogenase/glutarate-semialdehyde dehydrogenase
MSTITAQHLDLFIDGRWQPTDTGDRFEVTDPATGQLVGIAADAGSVDVHAALDAAFAARGGWAATAAGERARILRAAAAGLREQGEDLAGLMTAEQGKPLAESRGEVDYAASFFDWFAGEAERIYGHTVPAKSALHRILVQPQPVGVTAAVTPWNFPAAMLSRKLGPALASGCTSIVKPAEQTPLTAAAVVRALADAGLPNGVVNLLTTSRPAEVVEALFADPRLRMLSFTGSTEVGKRLIALSARHVVRLGLELGGHAPYVVFEDADLDAAVAGVMASKFRNAGQTCVCANRVFVHRTVLEEFVRRVTAASRALAVGPGIREGVQIGALIDDAGVRKVERHVSDALDHGAQLRCGGGRPRGADFDRGHFFEPTVLDGVTSEMLITREETFGPVLGVQEFDSEREVVELANASPYGLAAYLHTRDLGRVWRVSEALEYGIVGVNEGLISAANVPFGGIKESGYGREGGFLGIEEYLEHKYVLVGGLDTR